MGSAMRLRSTGPTRVTLVEKLVMGPEWGGPLELMREFYKKSRGSGGLRPFKGLPLLELRAPTLQQAYWA